ncbi:MAG: PLDc_N domain-containing protein [Lentisphaeria bacterium]|nr:PLDc_N domain-containing protein [Lentisphaeria bacterium]
MQLAVALLLALWLISLVSLCSRRDIDVHSKITWVVVVLVFNGFGAILYFVFAPKRQLPEDHPDVVLARDCATQRIVTTGSESWNPIVGCNASPPGQGLNPPATKDDSDGSYNANE